MMAKLRWLGLGVLGMSLFLPIAVRAGWEGELRNSGKGAPREVQGRKVEIQGHRMRMETEMAGMGRSVFIVDWKTGKAQTVLDSNRMVLEMDLRAAAETAGLSVPWCEPGLGAVEHCLKSQGFVKAGTEPANGHPCEIYEQKSAEGTTRIWRPTGLDGLPALRTVRLNAAGKEEFRSDIMNVAKKEFEAKRFEVPANYIRQDMTAMMGAMMKAGAARKGGKQPKGGQ